MRKLIFAFMMCVATSMFVSCGQTGQASSADSTAVDTVQVDSDSVVCGVTFATADSLDACVE